MASVLKYHIGRVAKAAAAAITTQPTRAGAASSACGSATFAYGAALRRDLAEICET